MFFHLTKKIIQIRLLVNLIREFYIIADLRMRVIFLSILLK